MKFFDFTDQIARAHAEAQDDAEKLSLRTTVGRQLFPSAAEMAGFRFLREGSSLNSSNFDRVLIVGVATWSDPDLLTLERLAAVVRGRPVPVYVFDIDDWSIERIGHVISQAPRIDGTPVAAYYQDGQLSYFAGRDAILGLDQF